MSQQRPLCACGCGHPTPLASKTDPRDGHIKGQPTRFVKGHRILPKRAPEPTPNRGQITALRLAANGMTSRQIATRLGTTERGIHLRLKALADWLGAGTRAQAVAIALRTGLLSFDDIDLPTKRREAA